MQPCLVFVTALVFLAILIFGGWLALPPRCERFVDYGNQTDFGPGGTIPESAVAKVIAGNAYQPTSAGLYNKPFELVYAYRDLDEGPQDIYDSRFSLMSGDDLESTFAATQRLDHNPYLFRFNGQLVHLAQRHSADDWRTIKSGPRGSRAP